MTYEASIIEDSISGEGVHAKRLTTFQLKYWRAIHGEVMTHRVFSRNASSSRAIPVKKVLAQVWSNPAGPVHWGVNQPGMQAKAQLSGWRLWAVKRLWGGAAKTACAFAWAMSKLGLHKQVANRILEPYQWMHTIVTATEWTNFFDLRAHADAQPEFQELARGMLSKMRDSHPTPLMAGQWHLPYVSGAEKVKLNISDACKVSAARCARVSYLTHDGKVPNMDMDLKLFERLAGGRPLHASPLEHQGTPGNIDTGNLVGWTQYRKLWEKTV